MLQIIREEGVEIIKIDTDKMMEPGQWGWRPFAVDMRMPNGQLVEFYSSFTEMIDAQDTTSETHPIDNHKLFEKWRNVSESEKTNNPEYQKDVDASYAVYQEAWEAGLKRAGYKDDAAASASFAKAVASLGSVTRTKSSSSSSAEGTPSDQTPSEDRRIDGNLAPSNITNADESRRPLPTEKGNLSTDRSSKNISSPDDIIPQEGDTKPTQTQPRSGRDLVRASLDRVRREKAAADAAKKQKDNDDFGDLDDLLGVNQKSAIEPEEQPFFQSKYEKFKPALEKAFGSVGEGTPNERVDAFINKLNERYPIDALEQLEPYLVRFVEDYILTATPNMSENNDVEATDDFRRKQTDEDGQGRDAGEGSEDVRGTDGGRHTEQGGPRESERRNGDAVSDGERSDQSDRDGADIPHVSRTDTETHGTQQSSDADSDRASDGVSEGRRERRRDYLAPEGSLTREGSWRQAAENNLNAIELAKKIESEDRAATPEEQAILAKFVGWGASELANNAFREPTAWGMSPEWKKIAERMREVMTPEEIQTARRSTQYAHYTSEQVIRGIWSALNRFGFQQGTILEPGMGIGLFPVAAPKVTAENSSYTGVEMDAMTARIAKLLLPDQTVLPTDFTKQRIPANHFDVAIGNPPFSKTVVYADRKYSKLKLRLHDYFFAKSLDSVRPGGLLAFVTSNGTMDKKNNAARAYLAESADLLGAIRLPQTAFKQNAGTEVVTDVLFFRKRMAGEEPSGVKWLGLAEVTAKNEWGADVTGLINEYFVDHPEMVLGEHSFTGSMYASDSYTVVPKEGDIEAQFLEAVDNLPKAVFAKQAQAADTATKAAERDWSITAKKEGSLYIHDDGRLMIVDGGSGIELSATKKIPASHLKMLKDYVALRNALKQAQYDQLHAEDDPAIKIAEAKADIEKQLAESGGTKERAIERFGRMNDLDLMRTITQHAMKIGASPKQYATALSDVLGRDYITMWPVENELSAWEVSLAALNKEYDAFVKKHGNILEFTEREVTKSDEDGNLTTNVIRTFKKDNILRNDIESALVKALERVTDDGTIEKGAPLLGRQIKPPAPPKIENLNDALMVSLDTLGHLNLDHVAELVRPIQEMTREDVIAALGDAIYEEPGGGGRYVMADEYLSGNVREKLELAEAAASDKRFRRNVEALRKVQPLPLAAEKISIQLGATWVPAEHVSEFAKQVLGLKGETLQRRGQHGSAVYFDPATNRWTVPEAHGSGARNARSATAEYGTEHRSPAEILEAALNDQSVTITSTDEHGKKYPNKDAIAAVRAKIEKMNQAFRPWLFSDAARGKALVSLYNEKLNVMAPREFNGSHLTTPGLSVKFKLHPHVKRGIWRIIQTGNTYLAHAVGAGKTLQMIASAMEQKRLGLISKPMFVVPRHMLQQFSSEFLQAYPLANIMVADEESFHTDNRRQFVARAALNDLDGIIITHSAFGLLRTRPESSSSVLDELLADMHFELDRLTTGVTGDGKRVGDSMQDTRTIKQIEQRIEAIEQKFFGRMNASRDNVVDFEDLGVDFLYVDEAHEFRKLDFVTNQTNIKGIDPQGSMRALDLMVKSRWLDQQRPGRSLVMASGTPITNTMAELYTIQRFFDPHGLAANTLSHFDAWAKEFGQIEENVEPNAAGGYRLVKRFSKFVNTGILMQHVRSFMDVITLGQLQGLIKIPSIRTNTEGKAAPQVVITERYPELEAYLKGPLSDRITASEAWKPSPSEPNNPDPMIAIIADGQLAAFDMRFIYPSLPSNPASKLNRLADGIIDSYHAYNDIEYTNPSTGEPYPIKGAAHIVFSYSGFGDQVAKNRGFNARQWLRKRLTEGGIPNNEIAFISDYKTTSAKAALFKEVREGKKKILIGSPKNMGTGVNAQLRLKTLHYGVAPWYPADIEQPHGRILRHGNQNPEVEVNWYAAKGTYDEAQWGMLARKSKAIEDAMTGKFDGDIEDVSESSQYAMASALASGDPRALRLAELRGVVEKYSRLEQAYHASQSGLRADLRDFNSGVSNNSISWNEQQLKRHEDAIAIAPSEKVDRENFTIQIGKKAFTPSEDVKVTDIGKTLQDAWRREVQRFTKEAVESRALQRGTVATVFGKHEVRASVWADGHSIKSDLAIYIGDVCISLTDLSVKPTDIDNVSSSGLITRIYNAFNGLGDAVKDRAAKIEKLKQQRAATEEALRKPFEFEDELNNARAELNQLGMEMAGVDLAIPPDTITADELKELADDYNLHDDKGDVDEPTLKSAVPLNDTSSEGSGLDANGNLMPEAAKGIAEERANIEKGAKADGTWLKAPNGDTSKLTPHQWIDSRTTRFKRWFGDWELGAKTTSIVTAARHTFTDLQDAARWAKTHITGTYRNKETGHRIIVSGNAISKYLSEKAVAQSSSMPYHLATLRVLPDLIRNAILIETHADASGNARVAEMQRYYAAVRIAGDLRRVELTVRAFKSGDTRHYSYEVTQIKTLGGSLAESVEANASNRTPSVTMATLLQGAKKNNGETFDTLASKAIDANGEPLVVYRGDVKANDGIFYTSSPAIAEGYTRSTFFRGGTEPQTTAAFLSLHNPLVIDAKGTRNDNIPVPWSEWKPKTFGNLPKSAVSVADAYDYAIKHGHDGLIVKNVIDTADPTERAKPSDVYAVKDQSQVKSAIGNRGSFSKSENSIVKQAGDGHPSTSGNWGKKQFNALVKTLKRVFPAHADTVVHEDAKALAKVLGQDPESVFFAQEWKERNETFNNDLDRLINGTIPNGHVFQMGNPTRILQSAGVPNLPIELAASLLKDKSRQKEHPFDLADVKNLPTAIQNPIAVFDSATMPGRKVILTELEHTDSKTGKVTNFVAALEINATNRRSIQVNDVRSVYPRESVKLLKSFGNDTERVFADKDKALKWLSKYESNSHKLTQPFEGTNKTLGQVIAEVKEKVKSHKNPPVDTTQMQAAWHVSPHKFDKFSTDFMGTGEGAQAYGWGLYFTTADEVKRHYEESLRGKVKGRAINGSGVDVTPSPGATYKVDLKPSEDEYLLWDKPLSEQSEKVKAALNNYVAPDMSPPNLLSAFLASDYAKQFPDTLDVKIARRIFKEQDPDDIRDWADKQKQKQGTAYHLLLGRNGSHLYHNISHRQGTDKAASEYLLSLGIRGIKYLDGSSRGKGEGDYNYVIFSDSDVEITGIDYLKTPDGTIFGATYIDPETGKRNIYINPENLNPETLLHEIYHPFDDAMAQAAKQGDAHAKAAITRLDEIADEGGYLKRVKENKAYANLNEEQARSEARVQMVGEYADKTITQDEGFISKLKRAINDAVKWIADKLGLSLKQFTPEQILNMSVEDINKASLQSAAKGEFGKGRSTEGVTMQAMPKDGNEDTSYIGSQGTYAKDSNITLKSALDAIDNNTVKQTTVADLRAMAYKTIDEILPDARVEVVNGNIKTNIAANELYRKALEEVRIKAGLTKRGARDAEDLFIGAFQDQKQTAAIQKVLTEKRDEAKSLGYSPAEIRSFDDLINALDESAKAHNGTAVVYVMDEALAHEVFHRADYLGSMKGLMERHTPTSARILDGHDVTQILTRQKFAKLATYRQLSGKEAMRDAWIRSEVPPLLLETSEAELAKMGITPEMRDDYLLKWFQGYVAKNGIQSLDNFETEELDVKRFIDQLRHDTDTGPEKGSEPPVVRNGPTSGKNETDTNRQSQPRTTATADGGGSAPSPGRNEGRSDRSDRSGDTGRANVKLRSLPQTMRAAGIYAIDEAYEVFSDKAATEEAERLLNDLGLERSVNLLRNIPANAMDAQHAILSFMLTRTLQTHADQIAATNPAEAQRAFDLSLELAREHGQRATQAGRFTRIASVIGPTTEHLIYAVQGIVESQLQRQFTYNDYQEWQGAGNRLETAVAALTEARRKIRNQQAEIRRLRIPRQITAREAENRKRAAEALDARYGDKIAELQAALQQQYAAPTITKPATDASDVTLKSGIDEDFPTDDFAQVGAMFLTKGLAQEDEYLPDDFRMEMRSTFGDTIDPYFDDIYKKAYSLRDQWLKDLRDEAAKGRIERKYNDGNELSQEEIDEIIRTEKAQARKRNVIEGLHEVDALNGRKNDLMEYVEMVTQYEHVRQAAEMILAKKSIPEIKAALAKEGFTRGSSQRKAIRDANTAITEAKNEQRAANERASAEIREADVRLKELEGELWERRQAVKAEQRAIRDQIARLTKGELAYYAKMAYDATNATRTMMASLDMSAALRQGGYFTLARPEAMGKAFADMFKSVTEKGYGAAITEIENHPLFRMMQRAGVDFAVAGRDDESSLTGGEEMFRGEV